MKTCEAPDCDVEFEPARSTARFHTATCRQRAARARKAADAHEIDEAKTDTLAEHGLVKAVRTELEQAKKDQTFSGQLAIQLARRLANPEESGSTALSKELRAVMAEALVSVVPPAAGAGSEPAPPVEDDQVSRARRAREDKARAAAAGRA